MATKKPNQFKEIGIAGLKAYGGFVAEEFLPELRHDLALRQYRQMAKNDAVVGAILFAIKTLARQADWFIVAADDSSAADEAREFVDAVLFKDLIWSDVVSEALTMLEFGFAPLEVVWKKRSDGKIGIGKIALRAQDTIQKWDIDAFDDWQGLWQQPWVGGVFYIPRDRLLLFRTESNKGNPQGLSILRTAWRSWKLKTRLEEIEGIGVERDLAGLPIVRVPGQLMDDSATTPEEKAQLAYWEELARNVKRDRQEGIVMPGDRDESGHYLYDITLLSTGGSRTFNTSEIIDRYDRRIATTVLADFIFLGQQATGSYALSSDKTALFGVAIGTFLDIIRDQINRVLIPRLWRLNGFKEEMQPRLEHGDIETPNLSELGNFVSNLSRSGMMLFPDQQLENALRKAAGLPEAPERNDDEQAAIANPMALIEQVLADKSSKPPEPDAAESEPEPDDPSDPANLGWR